MTMAFTPPTGLLDPSTYPTTPANETAARQQFMDLFYQLRDFLNNNISAVELANSIVQRDASRAIASIGVYTKGGTSFFDIQADALFDVVIFRSTGYAVSFNKTNGKITIGGSPVAMAQPTTATWIAPTLLNSWVNYGAPQTTAGYYKDDLGIVHIKGLIKSGTVTAGTVLFTLPAGYRPLQNLALPSENYNGTAVTAITLDILTDGTVRISPNTTGSNTWLSLDGLSFRAEQ